MQTSSPQKKQALTFLGVMAGFIVSYMFTQKFIFTEFAFDKQHTSIANEVNKSCPFMVDASTRMDNAIALPGNTLQYNYTIIDAEQSEVDTSEIKSIMTPQIRQHIKSSPQMAPLRDNKVFFNYHYSDMDGNFLIMITIHPEDYQ